MSTEYEQLLNQLLQERQSKLEGLRDEKGKEKQIDQVLSEIRFIQVELERYDRGLTIFRSKSVLRVGRWGKPEHERHAPPA